MAVEVFGATTLEDGIANASAMGDAFVLVVGFWVRVDTELGVFDVGLDSVPVISVSYALHVAVRIGVRVSICVGIHAGEAVRKVAAVAHANRTLSVVDRGTSSVTGAGDTGAGATLFENALAGSCDRQNEHRYEGCDLLKSKNHRRPA